MNAAQRRERILTRLNSAGAPLSASTLAAELGVSRQIVVGDVALLRAGGAQIDATPRGYHLHPAEKGYTVDETNDLLYDKGLPLLTNE